MKSTSAKMFLLGAASSVAVMMLLGAAPGDEGAEAAGGVGQVTKYNIVEASSSRKLSESVQKALADGWRIQGDVEVAISDRRSPVFLQVIVR